MKKILALITIISIALASCTSTKESLAIKRKYNKGYYIASNHKAKKQTSAVAAEKTSIPKAEDEISKTETLATEIKLSPVSETLIENTVQEQSAKAAVAEGKKPLLVHNTKKMNLDNATVSTVNHIAKQVYKEINIEKKTTSKGGGSDTNQILLIVFCFFPILSLVAMYLHDGKSITLNFWVDLLLYLTFIGYIIFALLVVLDIVNLA